MPHTPLTKKQLALRKEIRRLRRNERENDPYYAEQTRTQHHRRKETSNGE